MNSRASMILVLVIAVVLFGLGAPMVGAQESVIYSFVYATSDGLEPLAGLTPDAAGNFYGTTVYGGSVGSPYNFDGTVYELSPSGGGWTEKVLFSFAPERAVCFPARGRDGGLR